jgi:hypothetical protein
MKQILPILLLLCPGLTQAAARLQSPSAPAASSPSAKTASAVSASSAKAMPPSNAILAADNDDPDTRKAKQLVQQAIEALGGTAYLTLHDREAQGRTYGFHAGRPTGEGILFWSFWQFPDKERVEVTKERDVAELYVGDKGYEITYKGVHNLEDKDLADYFRRRHFSLDNVLRTWVHDPGVIFLLQGFKVAAQHPAMEVTLINAKDESVTLDFDQYTHLPIKKTFEWRDPVDRQKNLEEEIYENYKPVGGIMTPYNITRYFNGDMANERFIVAETVNQYPDPDMFNPNSGYDPNKEKGKKK